MLKTNAPATAVPDQPEALRGGCYLIRYTPIEFPDAAISGHYDGTLRVERLDGPLGFSGDLYAHLAPEGEDTGEYPFIEPYPAYYAGIPVFPRDAYAYYLRGVAADEPAAAGGPLRLRFELFRYWPYAAEGRLRNRGCYTATLQRTPAPPLFPSGPDFWAGPVCDCAGAVVGFLTGGWITPHLREAVVEMDKVAEADFPLNNGAAVGWEQVFEQLGWKVEIRQSSVSMAEPSGESWSDAELHAAMLEFRDRTDLDREWYYYLLCVRRVDITERGVMFDRAAVDSNDVPREGAAIASDWEIPDTPVWGTVRGMRFGSATPVYFRTALHEIGHALSLAHNSGQYIMQPTDMIAYMAEAGRRFPENIVWAFAPTDARRLRHFPDPVVRPGGEVFGAILSAPALPVEVGSWDAPPAAPRSARGFGFRVEPLLPEVPFGAPVRVHATLTNEADGPRPGPATLAFRSGGVRGRVTDPAGRVRTFCPLVVCADGHPVVPYTPGDHTEESYTLLRGGQGPLFPHPGAYRIEVDVEWEADGRAVGRTAATTVVVAPPRDAGQVAVATRILQSPAAFLTFVLAGDHLPDGVAAIEAAVADPVLRPHYAMAQVRRLGRAFRDRPATPAAAAAALDEAAVLSPSEIRRAAALLEDAPRSAAEATRDALAVLRKKAGEMTLGVQTLRPVRDAGKEP